MSLLLKFVGIKGACPRCYSISIFLLVKGNSGFIFGGSKSSECGKCLLALVVFVSIVDVESVERG